nr:hypothetical protein FAC6B23_03 [Penicillium fuscum]
MDAQPFIPEYLKGKRFGADTPSDLSQYLKWHWGHMTIAGEAIKGKIRVSLDTQEPRVEFTPFRNHRHGQIVFTATKTKPFIQLFDQQGQSSGAHVAFFKQHGNLKNKIDIDLVKSDLLVFEFKAHEKPPMPVSEREASDDESERKTWDFLNGLQWTDELVFLWLQFDLARIKTSYISAMNVVKSEGSHSTSGAAPPQQPAKRHRSPSPARRAVRAPVHGPPQQSAFPGPSSRLPPRLPQLEFPPSPSQPGSSSSGHREVNRYRSRSPMRQEAPVPPGPSLGLPAPPLDLPRRPPPREMISDGLFTDEESITRRLRDLEIRLSRSVQRQEEARQAEIQATMDNLRDELQQIRRRSRSPEPHGGP